MRTSKAEPADWIKVSLALQIDSVLEETCTFDSPETSHLLPVDFPSARRIRASCNRLTKRFQILDPGLVYLRGFRAFTDAHNMFFTDESLDPSWDRDAYGRKFVAGKHENYHAEFEGDSVWLAPVKNLVEITEPVVCLCSGEPSNYGSWLFRILPKLASLPDDDRSLFIHARSKWQFDFLSLFAAKRRFINHRPYLDYHFKNARIATMRNSGVYLDRQTKAFFRTACDRVDGTSSLRKIYLSRRGQRIRPMVNEAVLEAAVAAEGFAIIKPESLSLEDRIRIIRDAEIIICPGGSGLFNMVFAQNAKLIVDIEPNKTWIHAHGRLLESLRIDHAILFGEPAETGETGPHAPWHSPVQDISRLLRSLA